MSPAPADRTDEAISLFESGELTHAAAALRNVRMEALSHEDKARVAEIDDVANEMRGHLEGQDLGAFNKYFAYDIDAADEDARRFLSEEDVDVSPVGLLLALAGAAALVVAVFLPYAESTSGFARIAKNSLIQEGGGWLFVGLAVAAAFAI